MNNDIKILITAGVNEGLSIGEINKNIKEIQKKVNKLNLNINIDNNALKVLEKFNTQLEETRNLAMNAKKVIDTVSMSDGTTVTREYYEGLNKEFRETVEEAKNVKKSIEQSTGATKKATQEVKRFNEAVNTGNGHYRNIQQRIREIEASANGLSKVAVSTGKDIDSVTKATLTYTDSLGRSYNEIYKMNEKENKGWEKAGHSFTDNIEKRQKAIDNLKNELQTLAKTGTAKLSDIDKLTKQLDEKDLELSTFNDISKQLNQMKEQINLAESLNKVTNRQISDEKKSTKEKEVTEKVIKRQNKQVEELKKNLKELSRIGLASTKEVNEVLKSLNGDIDDNVLEKADRRLSKMREQISLGDDLSKRLKEERDLRFSIEDSFKKGNINKGTRDRLISGLDNDKKTIQEITEELRRQKSETASINKQETEKVKLLKQEKDLRYQIVEAFRKGKITDGQRDGLLGGLKQDEITLNKINEALRDQKSINDYLIKQQKEQENIKKNNEALDLKKRDTLLAIQKNFESGKLNKTETIDLTKQVDYSKSIDDFKMINQSMKELVYNNEMVNKSEKEKLAILNRQSELRIKLRDLSREGKITSETLNKMTDAINTRSSVEELNKLKNAINIVNQNASRKIKYNTNIENESNKLIKNLNELSEKGMITSNRFGRLFNSINSSSSIEQLNRLSVAIDNVRKRSKQKIQTDEHETKLIESKKKAERQLAETRNILGSQQDKLRQKVIEMQRTSDYAQTSIKRLNGMIDSSKNIEELDKVINRIRILENASKNRASTDYIKNYQTNAEIKSEKLIGTHKKTVDDVKLESWRNKVRQLTADTPRLRQEMAMLNQEFNRISANASEASRSSLTMGEALKTAFQKFPVWIKC